MTALRTSIALALGLAGGALLGSASAGTDAMKEALKNIDMTRAAVADLASTKGNDAAGTVVFVDDIEGRTAVHLWLTGLTPNSTHGFHIHENGDCSAPDATSAGGHFNPTGMPHSGRETPKRHAGDLGNVTADAKGIVTTRFTVPRLEIGAGKTDILGRGVIVHAKADDLKSQPSGDAGARIACGVIRRGTAADAS
ncbi:MAG: superoxide dismutase family protein [Burkholderiales bacterium]|nr:superoxide dismutase family protein [Burkholderiales bacterium]